MQTKLKRELAAPGRCSKSSDMSSCLALPASAGGASAGDGVSKEDAAMLKKKQVWERKLQERSASLSALRFRSRLWRRYQVEMPIRIEYC